MNATPATQTSDESTGLPATAGATWRALGTTAQVVVTEPALLADAQTAVAAVLAAVDAAYSRFRPDSELSLLNATAGRDVLISPLLALAVGAALRAARLTDGAVDPTIGRAIRRLGYDRDFASMRERGAAPVFVSVAGWEAVSFDANRRIIRVPRGVELDLGATGKGLAADLAARAALDAMGGRGGALVGLGGDISLAGSAPDGGWQILVSEDHATSAAADGERIALTDGAVATSTTTLRRWTRGGVERHHLLDPVTGAPATGPWRTATVAASTAADANTASTAAIVKGESALGWLAANNLPARLVAHDGAVVRLPGWPAAQGA